MTLQFLFPLTFQPITVLGRINWSNIFSSSSACNENWPATDWHPKDFDQSFDKNLCCLGIFYVITVVVADGFSQHINNYDAPMLLFVDGI